MLRPIRAATAACAGAAIAGLLVTGAVSFGPSFGPSFAVHAAGAATTTTSVAVKAATCTRLGVPTYMEFDVAGTQTAAVLAAQPDPSFVVLNPESGPGPEAEAGFVAASKTLRAAKVGVVGYVATGYGKRAESDVLQDVEHWRTWYGTRNVFFDEAPSDRSHLARYRRYVKAVHDAGGRAILNPGTYPDRAYVELADLVVTFEGSAADYASATVPKWADRYAPTKFWHLVYATPADQATATFARSRTLRAGYVYVTSGVLPDPWGALPPYWGDELSATATPASCASASNPWSK